MALSSGAYLSTIESIVQKVVAEFEPRFEQQKIQFETDLESTCRSEMTGPELMIVLSELIDEACDAMSHGGSLLLTGVAYDEHFEFEIADSREGGALGRLEQARHDRLRFRKCRELGVGIETLACPQGGLARTVHWHKQAMPRFVKRAA